MRRVALTNGVVHLAIDSATTTQALADRLRKFLSPYFQEAPRPVESDLTLTLLVPQEFEENLRKRCTEPVAIRKSSAPIFNLHIRKSADDSGPVLAWDEDRQVGYCIDRQARHIHFYGGDNAFVHLVELVRYYSLWIEEARGTTLLHSAAVVSVATGAVVAIVGHKGAGKTSTMLAMATSGTHRYFSGDKLLIDLVEGRLRARGWPDYPHIGVGALRQHRALVEDLGLALKTNDGTMLPDRHKLLVDPLRFMSAIGGSPAGSGWLEKLLLPRIDADVPYSQRPMNLQEKQALPPETLFEWPHEFFTATWHGLRPEGAANERVVSPAVQQALWDLPWLACDGKPNVTDFSPVVSKESTSLPKIVWLLVDGLSFNLLDEFVKVRPEGALGRSSRQGRIRPLMPLRPNCQTPPSLFTIWSGTGPEQHGMTGYDVPRRAGDDPTTFVDGFQAWPRDVLMVWDRYAQQGHTIRTCGVPFLQPDRLGDRLLSATDVFRPSLLQLSVLRDGDRLIQPTLGLDYLVRADKQGIRLDGNNSSLIVALNESVAIPLAGLPDEGEDTHRTVSVRAAEIDGETRLVSLGYGPVLVHGVDAACRKQAGLSVPYVVSNPGKLYAAGLLGLRDCDGGDGNAERLLLALMREVHRSFVDDFRWALRAGGADLLVSYYPVIDLLSHQLLRQVLDGLGNLRAEGAAADVMREALTWFDDFVAEIMAATESDVKFIVHSDHGMTPIHWDVRPNRFFVERGWLAIQNGGAFDLDHSLVFLHPAENGLLVFHRKRMAAAGLAEEDIVGALTAYVDALGMSSGFGLVAGPAAALGDDWRSDRYLQPPHGMRLRADVAGPVVERSKKGGDHTAASDDPWLRGVLLEASHVPLTGLLEKAILELTDISSTLFEQAC